MAEYIYLSSSLPLLSPDSDSLAQTPKTFILNTNLILNSKDSAYLNAINLNPVLEIGTPLYEYFIWEIGLRNEIARQKSGKIGFSTEKYIQSGGVAVGVDQLVAGLAKENPLAAENILIRARWESLDQVCGVHKFDITYLATYLIKLKLLERKLSWLNDSGNENYRAICTSLMNNYAGDVE